LPEKREKKSATEKREESTVGKREYVEPRGRSSAVDLKAPPYREKDHETAPLCKEGLFVEGTLEGETINMTIDTGSSISIVQLQVLKRLGVDLSAIQPARSSLRSVTGEKRPMLGRITLSMGIAGHTFRQNFWVVDVREDCILGLDFLQQHDCHIDVKDMTIEVRNVTAPLSYLSNESLSFACSRVVAMEDIRVMPHTEAIIPAKILDYSGGSTLGIIEANHLEAIPGLMVGKVLTKLCSDELIVPVRVANVAEEARDVVAGADLAKCELVSCVTDRTRLINVESYRDT
jgi:hypothetical protein